MPETADWERLGRRLQVQRVMLNPRYKNRSLFSRERGINYRLAQDIETAARENYDFSTRISVDIAYGWRPGSVDSVLAGREPAIAPVLPDGVLTPREEAIGDTYLDALRIAQDRRKAGNGD
jgi:hypothetical protein